MSFEHYTLDQVIVKYNLAHPRNKYFLSVEGIICHLFGRPNKRNIYVLECKSANMIRSKLVAHSIFDESGSEYYIHVSPFVTIYGTLGSEDVSDINLRDTSEFGTEFMNTIAEIKETTYKVVPNFESGNNEMLSALDHIKNRMEHVVNILEAKSGGQQTVIDPEQEITADDSISNVSSESDEPKVIKKSKATKEPKEMTTKEPIAGNIYLLHFKDNKEYYKVGRTKQTLKDRLKKYKNYDLVHSKEVKDMVAVEGKIIDDFNKKYKIYKGREWFLGGKDDRETMIGIIEEHTK